VVSGDDFTFARLVRGKKHIPYGEAGDCYSNIVCPQGRFSVNLSGTPFRVAPTTGWISNGGGSMDQHPDEVTNRNLTLFFLPQKKKPSKRQTNNLSDLYFYGG